MRWLSRHDWLLLPFWWQGCWASPPLQSPLPRGATNIAPSLSALAWHNESVQCWWGLGAGPRVPQPCCIFSTFSSLSSFTSSTQRASERPRGMTKVNTSANIFLYHISTSRQTTFGQHFTSLSVQQSEGLNNLRKTNLLVLEVAYHYPLHLSKFQFTA